MTSGFFIILGAFILGLLCCWLLVSMLGMGHRSINVLRDRYKTLDESFADLEKSFQAQDQTTRVERQALLNKLTSKDESIKALTSDKDALIIDAHKMQQSMNETMNGLNEELAGSKNHVSRLQQEITHLEGEVERLEKEIEMAKSRGDVAQSSDAEMEMLQHSMQRLQEMMEEEGAAYRQQIAELQQRLEQALSSKPRKDELTQINGIGPKIESILNSHQILSFADLANATEAQLVSVREELGGLANRIERDDWIGQAKELI